MTDTEDDETESDEAAHGVEALGDDRHRGRRDRE